jgi:hypothetical protein
MGVYCFTPNLLISRITSTITIHDYLNPTGYMCLDLSLPHMLARWRIIKDGIREITFGSCIVKM